MKIVTIIGTRPNFVKEMVLSKAFKENDIEEIIVHTGQHYDYQMSQVFFDELNIPKPNYHLNVSSGNNPKQTAEIMTGLINILEKEKPDTTLVIGDVNSTLAGAITSVKMKIPVSHIEAGVRNKNIFNPEEINRRATDSISSALFAVTKESYNNLIKENFPKDNIFFTGDPMKDALDFILKEKSININSENYVIATIHREENTNSKDRLEAILKGMAESNKKIIFLVHPRTEKYIKMFSLEKYLDKLDTIKPKGYVDFIRLLAGCEKVLTDSGGVRREAYLLGKPCIAPIDIGWFNEIIDIGWLKLVECDSKKISNELNNFNPKNKREEIFGDGTAAKKIANILVKIYGDKNEPKF